MVKVFKKDNKYLIYIPYEVVDQLHINQNDDVDFFKFSNTAFLFAKKADVASLLGGMPSGSKIEVSPDELTVLKKLDTLRYPSRTESNVNQLLTSDEKKVLNRLIDRKLVVLFNDEKRKEKLFSISKYVYDHFLMRKKAPEAAQENQEKQEKAKEMESAMAWGEAEPLSVRPNIDNEDVNALEKNGYVVLNTEAEAAALSLAIAESVRQGKVVGVRAFNKKYYIILTSFLEKNSPKIIKELKDGPKTINELSKTLGLDQEALRGILYVMGEQGDVTENRKDIFALVE